MFPADELFRPVALQVNGRKDRRLCVLTGSNGRQMRIMDLEGPERDAAEIMSN